MDDRSTTSATVRRLLLDRWPDRFGDTPLDDGVSLGAVGLGLDSIDLAELLFLCEDAFGSVGAEELLAAGPVTIGRLVDHFSAA